VDFIGFSSTTTHSGTSALLATLGAILFLSIHAKQDNSNAPSGGSTTQFTEFSLKLASQILGLQRQSESVRRPRYT
jgi:hypothetical protein